MPWSLFFVIHFCLLHLFSSFIVTCCKCCIFIFLFSKLVSLFNNKYFSMEFQLCVGILHLPNNSRTLVEYPKSNLILKLFTWENIDSTNNWLSSTDCPPLPASSDTSCKSNLSFVFLTNTFKLPIPCVQLTC